MFLYAVYLIIFAFMPIFHLLAPPEGSFAEPLERSESTESIETIVHRQHTEPRTLSRESSTVSVDEHIKQKKAADPKLDTKLKKIATKKYETSVLFKDTRADRYLKQAQKLPTELQQLLVDLSNKETSSATFQSSSKESLADVQKAIKTVAASKKGAFYSEGEQSSGLLEDLKSLEAVLKKRTLSPQEKQQEEGKVKSWEEGVNKLAERDKQQKEMTQRDKSVRLSDRQSAKPGTVDDYIADSAFEHVSDQKDPVLNPEKVTDQKHEVLTQQLTVLQNKLTELNNKKETVAYSHEEELNQQIAEIQKEINDIHQSLTEHHTALHKGTQEYLDQLTQAERDLKNAGYIYRKPIFHSDGNRYEVGRGTLFDLQQRVQELTRKIDSISEKISQQRIMVRQKEKAEQQNSSQIRTLTQESSTIDASIRELQSKISKVDKLLTQSFTERVAIERQEGGSVKAAKGFIETGKATAKLSDSALKEQKQELTAQLQGRQALKDQKSAQIATLRSTNAELSKQQEELQAQQTKLEQQQTKAEQEQTKSAAWLERETTTLEEERQQQLKEVKAELQKARAATEHHKAQVQQHQPAIVRP